ncbi:aminotransferase class III-fold pyridoxal phosphate-dependent enzyme, partial [bacterium]|nr:aminotransferase class III-fold pyridoxal phosphate-dependent enzyme [bacterium]
MDQSLQAFETAQSILVGGVNSPVRAFKSVGGHPVFFNAGKGAYLESVDGERYLDYVLSWGPMVLGHAHPDVTAALIDSVRRGVSFGAPTPNETVLAQLVQSFFPSMERIRFVNSGTEACMSAIRLARGVTGRKRIVKFDGCYHGHADSLLVAAGSGGLTLGVPDSAGVIPELAQWTTVLPYNDASAARACFDALGDEIAAVIVEPVAGNMGVVVPDESFLMTLRALCTRNSAVLIFDEVMTGFRVG